MTNPIKTVIATAIAGILGSSATFAAPSFTEKDITAVGWEVTYLGHSEYDAVNNTTTFFYSLTAGSGEKDLSHWVLALDDAPVASTGCNDISTGLDPTTGVSGWKCDDGQAAGSTQEYSITVNGNVGEAVTSYSVKGGTYFAVDQTMGPGEANVNATPSYSLSGVAYIDANNNGVLDGGEPVLPNVTVTLSDGQSTKTTLTGAYVFDNLVAGDYEVEVPAQTTEASDDFNEILAEYFVPATAAMLSMHVSSDMTGQNFGFGVNTLGVMDDFDAADPDGDGFSFTGTGKTIGFWKHQITSAKAGKTKGVQVSADTIKDYLYGGTSVRTLFIDVFSTMPQTADAAYTYALAILGSTSSAEVDLLKKQLMGTELNYQAGLGIANAEGLQGVLAAWSEYLVKNANQFTRDELLDAKDICDLINNSGE